MRRIIYHCAASIDGFIAREDGSFDCFAMEGPHVDDFVAQLSDYDTALMGRRTYEVGLAAGISNPYPMMATYVFSRTMKASPDPTVTLISKDAEQAVRALKAKPGADIWLVGARDLASSLIADGLVDEVRIKQNPLLLGHGIPLIASTAAPLNLDLNYSKAYDNGVVLLSYRIR
ncbi:MAG TPA: dihydrofolate reductase [Nannocystis exedens]|nr:dihydrofolate reductase [Nannocystis exedens]